MVNVLGNLAGNMYVKKNNMNQRRFVTQIYFFVVEIIFFMILDPIWCFKCLIKVTTIEYSNNVHWYLEYITRIQQ